MRSVHLAFHCEQTELPHSEKGGQSSLFPDNTWAPEQSAGDLPVGRGDTLGVVRENQEVRTDPDRSRDGQSHQ